MTPTRALFASLVALLVGGPSGGSGYHHMSVFLRGKQISVRVYDPPPDAPRRALQVMVISGDLGWLGIGGHVPGHLQAEGYRVIALNAQSYVAAFTGPGDAHLTDTEIARDFDTVMQAATVDALFPASFVTVGVSEGSGLAVMAMGQPGASPLCQGIIALALPINTALGWRWTDFPSWITKAEPHEPLADNQPYLARLRVPMVVLHSTHDEYDPIERVRAMFAAAPEPKRFIPVDAPNHRFSRRSRQVLALVDSSLVWMDSLRHADDRAVAR